LKIENKFSLSISVEIRIRTHTRLIYLRATGKFYRNRRLDTSFPLLFRSIIYTFALRFFEKSAAFNMKASDIEAAILAMHLSIGTDNKYNPTAAGGTRI